MPVKNLIFDIGGVLIDWNPRYLYRDIFEKEAEMETFLHTICSPAWNLAQDRGRPFEEGIQHLIAIHPEYESEIRAYREEWEQMIGGSMAGSPELLEEIAGQYEGLYALSNWSAETFPLVQNRFDFFKYFRGMVISGAVGLLKPDPAIYQYLLQEYALKASECLFVDDQPANVLAAQKLGFQGIVFQNADELARDLDKIL